jgi:hypothetical protein
MSKKRAPGYAGPSGYHAHLVVDGTLKTHRLRWFRQVQRHFPPTAAMAQRHRNDFNMKKVFAVSRRRAVPLKTGHKLRKGRTSDSAEYPLGATFRCRPCFASSTLKGINAGQVRRSRTKWSAALSFAASLLVRFLYASKENEQISKKINYNGQIIYFFLNIFFLSLNYCAQVLVTQWYFCLLSLRIHL